MNLRKNSNEEIKLLDEFFESVHILDLDKKASKHFEKFWKDLRREGRTINDFDVMIASIVKSNNLVLIIRDNHFKKLNIKSEII